MKSYTHFFYLGGETTSTLPESLGRAQPHKSTCWWGACMDVIETLPSLNPLPVRTWRGHLLDQQKKSVYVSILQAVDQQKIRKSYYATILLVLRELSGPFWDP